VDVIDQLHAILLKATGASSCTKSAVIQALWSGYGEIARYDLEGSVHASVVVKHVRFPETDRHPRGWNTDTSHERKITSYQVETAWYTQWSARCGDACRVPQGLALESFGDEVLMVLEDLDAAGFATRHSSTNIQQLQSCVRWLANFHATFLGEIPTDLWETGTYWHLETRPDELAALKDTALKDAALAIDQVLKASPFQTFVHGDAKLANFCFSPDDRVAAVDFQYTGGGCGMKDLAYLIGSCLREEACEEMEALILQDYFSELNAALTRQGKHVDFEALESDWRALYPFAWTDFHRFLKGWSPGHWKINSYSERIARTVLAQVNGTRL
jgi:hypothetical protein